MGYRIVRMSCELFEQFFTEGWSAPSRAGDRVVCTKGLPEGAELENVSMQFYWDTNDIALKFSHPSWPDLLPGDAIPEIRCEYRMETIDPPVVIEQVSADSTTEAKRLNFNEAPYRMLRAKFIGPDGLTDELRADIGGFTLPSEFAGLLMSMKPGDMIEGDPIPLGGPFRGAPYCDPDEADTPHLAGEG